MPTFATAGFKESEAAAINPVYGGTTSRSTSSTLLNAATKRPSPDYFVNSDTSPQSPKRFKKDNKENFGTSGTFHAATKGTIAQRLQNAHAESDDERRIRTNLPSNSERNPFARLNEKLASAHRSTQNEGVAKHTDLAGVRDLSNLLELVIDISNNRNLLKDYINCFVIIKSCNRR